ncbi:undecaprenyl-diphosphatase [Acinetobacter sp. MD2(2019)]|uniref:undecaprenyl-diphosphatase n=1 Tax=Acinetobacter sp. MD2(2019) TaxID=2605273 RepID=UPI002D1E652A|nr:undecaprenyl-diphosphatase [Acinetobacter sp. MD2(2019)]MEB3754802.1 undecaprenyl-diphosphatase [Acinetobacter sp. MD2(2019)]
MSLETVNLALFSAINASATAKPFVVHLAIFIANDVLYILLALLLFLWCYGDLQLKERALKAVVLTGIALLLGYVISLIYPHSRPFVLHVGRTLIEHKATASFPSNHMLIFSTIALSYYFSARKCIGSILFALAAAVAWSRVYLGVHFPLDMLGGLIVAVLVNIAGYYAWQRYGQMCLQLALRIYQWVAKPLLQRGLIK